MSNKKTFTFTKEQEEALKALESDANVFLTGSAGTGKSFVIKSYIDSLRKAPPILASTGAAAVLVNGRTLHSYFGLGIMKGGVEKTVKRALQNSRVWNRLAKDNTIIIDEISMIHPQVFEAANLIAQKVRYNKEPFGGIRLIVVGDFLQLPPIDVYEKKVPWLFELNLWKSLAFTNIELKQSMRTSDKKFVEYLSSLRMGKLNSEVKNFLNSRTKDLNDDSFEGTVLFGRRAPAEAYNMARLAKLKGKRVEIPTEVIKKKNVTRTEDSLVAMTPLVDVLSLKPKALVMIRKNDSENQQYVNGSLAKVESIEKEKIKVELLSGKTVTLAKEVFEVLDGDGKVIASIRNFPLTLAWATTIHKSQGASIDRVYVNLSELWENGQAYVALSRARSPEGLFINKWSASSIKADPSVVEAYSTGII